MNQKSKRFLKSTQELICHRDMKWLLMTISEALGQKMSSTKEGLFNFLFTSLFHPCKEGSVIFHLSRMFPTQWNSKELRTTNWSGERKRSHSRVQTSKGRVAALAIQFLRYK